jgi:hypothetical protein
MIFIIAVRKGIASLDLHHESYLQGEREKKGKRKKRKEETTTTPHLLTHILYTLLQLSSPDSDF